LLSVRYRLGHLPALRKLLKLLQPPLWPTVQTLGKPDRKGSVLGYKIRFDALPATAGNGGAELQGQYPVTLYLRGVFLVRLELYPQLLVWVYQLGFAGAAVPGGNVVVFQTAWAFFERPAVRALQ
jgi:hypothetical protein